MSYQSELSKQMKLHEEEKLFGAIRDIHDQSGLFCGSTSNNTTNDMTTQKTTLESLTETYRRMQVFNALNPRIDVIVMPVWCKRQIEHDTEHNDRLSPLDTLCGIPIYTGLNDAECLAIAKQLKREGRRVRLVVQE